MKSERRRRERGFALLATLALLMFLGAMITVALRHNIARRKYLKTRKGQMAALRLAESAVQEAIHALAKGQGEGSLTREIARGQARAEWRGVDGDSDLYEIDAVGIARPWQPASPRKRVLVRVSVKPGGETGEATFRIVSSAVVAVEGGFRVEGQDPVEVLVNQ